MTALVQETCAPKKHQCTTKSLMNVNVVAQQLFKKLGTAPPWSFSPAAEPGLELGMCGVAAWWESCSSHSLQVIGVLFTFASPGQRPARLEPGAGEIFLHGVCALMGMLSAGLRVKVALQGDGRVTRAANAYKVHTRCIHSVFKVHAECTQSALQSALQRALQVQQHHAVALRPRLSLDLSWECVHLLLDGSLSIRKSANIAAVLYKSLVILFTTAFLGQRAALLEPAAGATFVD